MTMAAEPGDIYSDELLINDREKEPRTLALDRCDGLIKWYEKNKSAHRIYWRGFQISAIVLSGLTPVLVLMQTALDENEPWRMGFTILIALFPALAAIITSLDGLFQWRDTYASFSHTSELLKSEKIKYLTRSTRKYSKKLDEDKALENFVSNIERITLEETTGWRTQIEQALELDELVNIASGEGNIDDDKV